MTIDHRTMLTGRLLAKNALKKAVLILILLGCPLVYGNETVSEESLKAAFIFNFLKFVEWDDTAPTYNICIPDDAQLRKVAAESLRGKTLNHREIVVAPSAETCHVLVSNSFSGSDSTLTIGPLDQGAMFVFIVANNKLKFAMNIDNIKKSKLKISSQLLKLAVKG